MSCSCSCLRPSYWTLSFAPRGAPEWMSASDANLRPRGSCPPPPSTLPLSLSNRPNTNVALRSRGGTHSGAHCSWRASHLDSHSPSQFGFPGGRFFFILFLLIDEVFQLFKQFLWLYKFPQSCVGVIKVFYSVFKKCMETSTYTHTSIVKLI